VPSWPEPEDEDEILGDSDDEETCNNADCNLGIDDEEYDEWMATVEGEPEKKNEGSNVFGRMLNVLKNLVILGGGVVVVLAVIGGIAGKKH
jgi:hypothetical protein